jgi:prepilin-type N-terminal cleavage/methylation domain-containing protein
MIDRRGFTVVELLIAVILSALLVLAALEILASRTRIQTVQGAAVTTRQATRISAEMLQNELREVSAAGGDVLAANRRSLRVRKMNKFGVSCDVAYGWPIALTVSQISAWFTTNDSIVVFADGAMNRSSDDRWHRGTVTSVDTTATCPDGSQAARVTLSLPLSTSLTTDSVRTGAPVRSYATYTYSAVTIYGDEYLGRERLGRRMMPFAGPLRSGDGVEFEYFDAWGNATTTPADVEMIIVTLRSATDVIDFKGDLVIDSIRVPVYLRN